VVDASVWISRFVPSDVHHQESRAWLEAHLSTGSALAGPRLLLVEVATAIARRTGDATLALEITRSLAGDPQLVFLDLDAALIEAACQLGAELRLRANDAIYAAEARRLAVPLYSWDDEHVERAGALRPTSAPKSQG
jgi:predicted nucleic acid-binding protein